MKIRAIKQITIRIKNDRELRSMKTKLIFLLIVGVVLIGYLLKEEAQYKSIPPLSHFIPNKILHNESMSGETGFLKADGSLFSMYGRDFMPGNKTSSPAQKEGHWEIKGDTLILTGTAISDGVYNDINYNKEKNELRLNNGYITINENGVADENLDRISSDTFRSEEECEKATGEVCDFMMCDYIPAGKTFEEVCGKNFESGWASTGTPLTLQYTEQREKEKKNFFLFRYIERASGNNISVSIENTGGISYRKVVGGKLRDETGKSLSSQELDDIKKTLQQIGILDFKQRDLIDRPMVLPEPFYDIDVTLGGKNNIISCAPPISRGCQKIVDALKLKFSDILGVTPD